MADEGSAPDDPPHGVVRPRGPARRRGDDDARAVPVARVVVYSAPGCGLCAPVIETVRELQRELGFELDVVDIDGDGALESRYREWLPVVEIDGERAFVHFVDAGALRDRLV